MPGSRRFSTGHLAAGITARTDAMVRGEAVASAVGSFIALLAAGGLLAISGRLLDPSLAPVGSARSAATAVVVLALACLGAPIHVGQLTVRALPLGGLAVFASALVWSARRFRASSSRHPFDRAPGGPWVAVPLAALAAISASAFRVGGPTPVAVDAPSAAGLAALWGALFGGLGRLTDRPRPWRLAGGRRSWRRDAGALGHGVKTGIAMLSLTFCGAGGGLLLWLVIRCFGAATGSSGAASAAGTVLVAAIFLPNLLSGAAALALGASVTTGAHMALGGVARHSAASLSLVDGGGPWYLAALLVVPPLACFMSGAAARRHLPPRSRAVPVLALAAVTYSAGLAGLAAVSGLTVTGPTGAEAAVGANVAETAALAFASAVAFGCAGWFRGTGSGSLVEADVGPPAGPS